MILIAPNSIEQQTLRVGNSVAVTAGAGGEAMIECFDGTAVLLSIRLSASQGKSFGPYNKDMRFRVSAIGDEATWNEISAPNQAGWAQGGSSPAGSSYVFDQMTALATWAIAHGLNRYPSVTVVDSTGTKVDGDVHYDDADSITVYFSAAFAGVAYLN